MQIHKNYNFFCSNKENKKKKRLIKDNMQIENNLLFKR